jgi:nonsense-mediated mRNA decay protein 3
MALCLKKLKGLAKVKLIDANFLWTEPHSKRIKLKLSIQVNLFLETCFLRN